MVVSFDSLNKNKDILDKINVFPIADGDTGKNLCYTVSSIEDIDFINLKDFLSKIIEVSIMSAKGSSGNILALYIMGLSKNYNDDYTIMCREAANFTWNTMYNPVEGTILTAMKDVPESYESSQDFIYKFIQNTYKNLFNGPDLLPVLKENKTLDSGTLGFLYILCDIYRCVTGKDISPNIDLNEPVYIINDDVENRYCVEVSLDTKDNKLKSSLSKMGSELIYLESNKVVKLHIHTNNYLDVINLCKYYGDIKNYKIEDMLDNNKLILIDE